MSKAFRVLEVNSKLEEARGPYLYNVQQISIQLDILRGPLVAPAHR